MKVGTDGVLLGAWAKIGTGNILDIGTGTGLIALMLAQRTTSAKIDAIEIEPKAYQEASENFNSSNWSNRVKAHLSFIQNFIPTKKYDYIISNPPFFIDSTKALKSDRSNARHTDTLSFSDLIDSVVRLLNPDGIFSLILPITETEQFIELAEERDLFLKRQCVVKPNTNKSPRRILMEFSFYKTNLITEELTIETETRHQYTKEYISLTKDFYLNF